jgi:hypothetical protein
MFRTIIGTRRETSGRGSNKFSPYVGRMAPRAHNFNKNSLGSTSTSSCELCTDCGGIVTQNTSGSGSGCLYTCNLLYGGYYPCNY